MPGLLRLVVNPRQYDVDLMCNFDFPCEPFGPLIRVLPWEVL